MHPIYLENMTLNVPERFCWLEPDSRGRFPVELFEMLNNYWTCCVVAAARRTDMSELVTRYCTALIKTCET